MTEGEFVAWMEYHRRFPLDDHARIYRPAATIAAAMGGNFEATLDLLSPKPRRKIRRATVVRPT